LDVEFYTFSRKNALCCILINDYFLFAKKIDQDSILNTAIAFQNANGLNMMRAASYSISVFGLSIFKFTKSFSMKMILRHALYLLLAAGVYIISYHSF